jgi:hypothetical protein
MPFASLPVPGTNAPMKIGFSDWPVTGSNATRAPLIVAGTYSRGTLAGLNVDGSKFATWSSGR